MSEKHLNAKSGKEVLAFAKANNCRLVDYKFCDIPGTWQHFTTTLAELEESTFKEGLGFDGSSIRGWKSINSSDMLVLPDPATAPTAPAALAVSTPPATPHNAPTARGCKNSSS